MTLGGVPDGLINGVWFDHKFKDIKDSDFTQKLMGLPLTQVSYDKTTVLDAKKKPKIVILSTAEPNVLKFGKGTKSMFEKLSDSIEEKASDVKC